MLTKGYWSFSTSRVSVEGPKNAENREYETRRCERLSQDSQRFRFEYSAWEMIGFQAGAPNSPFAYAQSIFLSRRYLTEGAFARLDDVFGSRKSVRNEKKNN